MDGVKVKNAFSYHFSVTANGIKEEPAEASSMKCINTVGEVSSTCSLGSPEDHNSASPLFLVTVGVGSPESSMDEMKSEG